MKFLFTLLALFLATLAAAQKLDLLDDRYLDENADPTVVHGISEPATIANGLKFSHAKHEQGYCGNFASADYDDTNKNVARWVKESELVRVSSQSCNRVRCHNNMGLYLCNTANRSFVIENFLVIDLAEKIQKKCKADYPEDRAMSGQLFLHNWLSVITSYANCHHDHRRGPYYKMNGPEGMPAKVNYIGKPPSDKPPKGMIDERSILPAFDEYDPTHAARPPKWRDPKNRLISGTNNEDTSFDSYRFPEYHKESEEITLEEGDW